MYNGNSEQYWKQRSKSWSFIKSRAFLPVLFLVICFAFTLRTNFVKNRRNEKRRLLQAVQYEPTQEQHGFCDLNMREVLRIQCDDMCKSEEMSIPRPTMYQACHLGCSRAFYLAAVVGCRQGLEEKVLEKVNEEAHTSCSRYIGVEPKPVVESTCKKYYREATKRGRKAGFDFIGEIIRVEIEKKRRKLEEEYL